MYSGHFSSYLIAEFFSIDNNACPLNIYFFLNFKCQNILFLLFFFLVLLICRDTFKFLLVAAYIHRIWMHPRLVHDTLHDWCKFQVIISFSPAVQLMSFSKINPLLFSKLFIFNNVFNCDEWYYLLFYSVKIIFT